MGLKNEFSKSYFELAIEKTIKSGEDFFVHDIADYFAIEIDYPADLLMAENLLKPKG